MLLLASALAISEIKTENSTKFSFESHASYGVRVPISLKIHFLILDRLYIYIYKCKTQTTLM